MAILLTGLFVAVVLWIVRARLVARQRLQMPYLNFEGDNSPMRYTQQSTSLLDVGYEKVESTLHKCIDQETKTHPSVVPQKRHSFCDAQPDR
jgi:hypothetical protein